MLPDDSTSSPARPGTIQIAAAQPPSCNTGAQNSLGVDYLALTCRRDATPRTIAACLGLLDEEREELPRGGYGYQRSCKYGHIRIYYAGSDDMGSYCQISGEACRELEARGLVADWQEFAGRCLAAGLTCKRLDVYKDDRGGLLDLDELERKFAHGEVTTHAQTYERRSKRARGLGGQRITDTLNLGSRQSESFMRIYDKARELCPRGRKMDEWRAEHGHHLRSELELKGKRAQAALKALAAQGLEGGLVVGLIRGFVDFKESDASGHNGRRVPTWAPWAQFLESAAKVRLAVDADMPTLVQALEHHKHQWAPILATEFMWLGGDKDAIMGFVSDIVKDGKARMKAKHYRLLREAA